jgi:hypothetical protein
MPFTINERVKETTTTTGTGTYTLAGAVAQYQAFSVIGNGNTCPYVCTDTNTDWEVGIGTYTAAGTTLARTTILASSNAGAAVNWGAGTKTIACAYPAKLAVILSSAGPVVLTPGITAFAADAAPSVTPSASGTASLAMGDGAVASAIDAIAIGRNTDATSNNAIAIGGNSTDANSADANGGYSIAIGNFVSAGASAHRSVAIGYYAATRNEGQIVISTSSASGVGKSLSSDYVIGGITTSSTPTKLSPSGTDVNRIYIAAKSVYTFTMLVNAIMDTSYLTKSWEIKGAIKRNNSNTTTLVGSVSTTIMAADTGTSALDVTVTANDTDEALQVQVVGDASTQVNWTAVIMGVETALP